ncbi:MAG: IS982 family transposase [Ardenticatenaceae bacterium]|nr:IS982 family transposase [Ardenticatenaceae bacterium]MCB9419977.1 IS982 family transposase [Ardenticatenaceae bacterium]MCB9422402.1 IS982 family transposase [Ardenticatenaceae bacterium]MCB9422490.1 IS982 family transposase [Ardenticatenaceae bacterium]MCB9422744.1 IS982 family transposase [Ardenticatenaceae bacterium]
MRGLTDYITQAAWSDILTVQYVLVDDSYQQLDVHILPERKFAPQGTPCFSDSEVITIALLGEMVFAGDEDKTLHFIRQYHLDMFPHLLDNSRFNRRRHQLAGVMEAIREHLRDRWRAKHPLDIETENLRIVDSAPISICTYTRGGRCQSIPLDWRDEWFGVCTSKKAKFFGARCHITTTLDQMIDTWLLAPGSYDDRKPMAALLENRHGLSVIGDKGYVSEDLAHRLWEDDQHLLLALKKDNQTEQWPDGIQRILGYLRHRVETAFSVLENVFDFESPKSRSLAGLIARTTTKILAYTISFFLAEILTPELSN